MRVVAPPVRMFVRAAHTMAACLTQPAIRRIRNQRVPSEATAAGPQLDAASQQQGHGITNSMGGHPCRPHRSASHVVQSVESRPTDYWHFQREIPAIGGADAVPPTGRYSAASRPATESTCPFGPINPAHPDQLPTVLLASWPSKSYQKAAAG